MPASEGAMRLIATSLAALAWLAAPAQAAPPECGAQDVIDIVKLGFDTVQEYDLKSTRRLAGVDEIVDLGVVRHAAVRDKYDESRFCRGRARTSEGETFAVWFRVYVRARDNDFGGVRPCFAKYNPTPNRDCSADDAAKKPR